MGITLTGIEEMLLRWLGDELFWQAIAWKIAKSLIILCILYIGNRVLDSVIDRFVSFQETYLNDEQHQRVHTLSTLFKNIVRGVIWFVAAMIILSDFGIDTTSLLAGASIVAVAVGVGAQNLVKDFVAGAFIILENQYGIGDIVTIKNFTGKVENITLRTTQLRSTDNVLHTIPNGLVDTVSNQTKGLYVSNVQVSVDGQADTEQVMQILQEALNTVVETVPGVYADGANVGGIYDLNGASTRYDIYIPSHRSDAYRVRNAYRYEVKRRFEEARIRVGEYNILIEQK